MISEPPVDISSSFGDQEGVEFDSVKLEVAISRDDKKTPVEWFFNDEPLKATGRSVIVALNYILG